MPQPMAAEIGSATTTEVGLWVLIFCGAIGFVLANFWIILQIVSWYRGPTKATPEYTTVEQFGRLSDDLHRLDKYTHDSVHSLKNDVNVTTLKVADLKSEVLKDIHDNMRPLNEKIERIGESVAAIRAIVTRANGAHCPPGACGPESPAA